MHYLNFHKSADAADIQFPDDNLAWYDGRDEKLAKAFNDLANLGDDATAAQRLNLLWTLPIALVFMVIGLSVIQESFATAFTLSVVAIGLMSSPTVERWWRLRHHRALKKRIRSYEFGTGVLWDDDPMWTLLAESLKKAGLDLLNDILCNREITTLDSRVTPVLAQMLLATASARAALRGVAVSNNSDQMAYLRGIAAPTASALQTIFEEERSYAKPRFRDLTEE